MTTLKKPPKWKHFSAFRTAAEEVSNAKRGAAREAELVTTTLLQRAVGWGRHQTTRSLTKVVLEHDEECVDTEHPVFRP